MSKKNFSFRVGTKESIVLDRLQKSLPNKVSRNTILNAVIGMYRFNEGDEESNVIRVTPLDFCTGLLYEFIIDSKEEGKTTADLEIISNSSIAYLPKRTTIKLEYLSIVQFIPTVDVSIKLELNPDIDVYPDLKELYDPKGKKKWSRIEKVIIKIQDSEQSKN